MGAHRTFRRMLITDRLIRRSQEAKTKTKKELEEEKENNFQIFEP